MTMITTIVGHRVCDTRQGAGAGLLIRVNLNLPTPRVLVLTTPSNEPTYAFLDEILLAVKQSQELFPQPP